MTDAKAHARSADRDPQHQPTTASICSPASTPTSSRSTISPRRARPPRPPSTPAFLSHFGFAQNDPAAANITAAQMDTFLTTVVEPQFLGAGWQANWSNATDQKHRQPHRAQRDDADLGQRQRRRHAQARHGRRHDQRPVSTAIVSARRARTRSSTAPSAWSARRSAIIANLQSQTGIVEKRVTDASDRIKMQADLFERNIIEMEGVDPYEASTRVDDLLSQIETSYALTARIQQLSLAEVPDLNSRDSGATRRNTTCTNSPMPTSRPTRSPTPRIASGSC